MKIRIDKRECGAGKTVSGIYSEIDYNISINQNTLLVVGSLELQHQYQLKYRDMAIINSTNSTETTVTRLNYMMSQNYELICITHQTFLMLQPSGLRKNYNLIIDEAISGIYKSIKFNGSHLIDYHWEQHFDPTDELLSITVGMDKTKLPFNEFHQIHLISRETDTEICSLPSYKAVTDRNYDIWTSPGDWVRMMDYGKKQSYTMYALLNKEVFMDWNAIHIAAAAFDYTPMYWMLKIHGFEMIDISSFTKHTANILYHYPTIDGKEINWSKTAQQQSPELLKKYHEYVRNDMNGCIPLTIRNTAQSQKLLTDEIELKHNVHGINSDEYMQKTHISLESALNPDKIMKSFIKDVLLCTVYDENYQNELVVHFFSAYLFYQMIMRCRIRAKDYNNEVINIYCLDYPSLDALIRYFTSTNTDQVKTFAISRDESIIPKKIPMSSKERVRNYRERHKEI